MKRFLDTLLCAAVLWTTAATFAWATESEPAPLRFRPEQRNLDVTVRDWEGQPRKCNLLLRWPAPIGGAPGVADSIRAVIAEWVFDVRPLPAGTTLDTLALRAERDPLRLLADESDHQPQAEVERSIDVAFDSLGVVSLNAYTYVFDGGAHGNHGWTCYNLDRRTGRRLTLDELFADGAQDSLRTVGERAFRRDQQIPDGQSLVDAGFWGFGERFRLGSSFHPTPRGIEFQYRDYDVTSYAAGPAPFTIPWVELRPLLRPDGPLAAVDP